MGVDPPAAVADLVRSAVEAHPLLASHANRLEERLRILRADGDLGSVRVEDLLLALACAGNDAQALATFDRNCIARLDRVLAHMRLPAETVDDIKQAVRTKLLLKAEAGKEPRILEYKGRGALASWVGVIATREALALLRSTRKVEGDEALAAIESPIAGPELGYLKKHYREAFALAFGEAMGELSSSGRNALRMHYLHGLSIDRLAQLYGVHRSNAARRIAKARDDLLSGTRRRLLIALNVDRSEIESVMRLVESRLDVSVQRLLESRRD